jgi:hypothetical protein
MKLSTNAFCCMLGGGQYRAGGGANGLLGSAAIVRAVELGLQIAALLVTGGLGAFHKRCLGRSTPLRRRLDRRLPALSSLRGQNPAHESSTMTVCSSAAKMAAEHFQEKLMTASENASITNASRAPVAEWTAANKCTHV